MLFDHHYQRSRYELKYLIDEACARRVRDFIRSHLRRDPHAAGHPHYAYPIYSLYLDGPGLTLYRATAQGQKNRYKLRIRYYDHDDNSPLFCEIKRRVNEVILKQRAVIRRAALGRLLAGCCPQPEDLCDPADTDSYGVLREFRHLIGVLAAEPRMLVYYEREAWVAADDDTVRVTFDRSARAAHYAHTLAPAQWQDAKLEPVILELKFDDRFPIWMRELVQSCDLYRTTMGKYVHCVEQIPQPNPPYAYATT